MASERWHAVAGTQVLERLSSRPEGLDSAEAWRRLAAHGPNELTRRRGPSAWAVLVRQFTSPLIYALLVSAAVAFALGEIPDGSVVLGVVVLNALIGFVQEYRAGRAIQALAQLVSEPAMVRRDGEWRQLPAKQLVPGDVVSVEAGGRIVADLRILDAHGLRADEAALTGESVPVDKTTEPVDPQAKLAERSSMLHGGTLTTSGTAQAVVVETGDDTQLGRISGLIDTAGDTQTPLTRNIARLGSTITKVIGVVAVVLLGVALFRGYPVADAALAAITLAVAAIPEGLPAIVTIALAIGVQRMARRRAMVRELPAVETLGETSVVCTDKTGTLTRNEMVLRRVWCPGDDEAEFEGVGYSPEGRVVQAGRAVGRAAGSVRELLIAGVLANEARLAGTGEDRTVLGDPTDAALLVGAERGGLDVAAMRHKPPRALLSFDSQRQYMAAAYDGPDGAVTYLKGAPEVLLALVGADVADAARAVLERLTVDGLRVLAIARRGGDEVDAPLDAGQQLQLLGLVAMIDPPRREVIEAIDACHVAGIQVKMITGDHAVTAAAIGRELGIVGDQPAMTGTEIATSSDESLRERVQHTDVFARVAPEHKLRLVSALQASGAVTAMTGDGVNDAPALRQADIGVAMGQAGTAAAKQAADIVLGDDNFATIRAAIEEGRRVYDNLVKALAFALPTNVGEGLIILIAVLAFPIYGGQPVLPTEPVQILWINLVATVSLALPLAFEAKEPGLMQRPPPGPRRTAAVPLRRDPHHLRRRPDEHRRDRAVPAHRPLGTAPPGFSVAGSAGIGQAQTLAVTSVAFFQIFYLLVCRTLTGPVRAIGWTSNRTIFAGIGILLILHAGFVHLPFMQALFHTEHLTLTQWAVAAAAGAVIAPVVSIEKWCRRRRSSPRTASPTNREVPDGRHV